MAKSKFCEHTFVLGLLYRDRLFRDAFFSDPKTTLKKFDLSQVQSSSLENLERQHVEGFAKTIKVKTERFVVPVFGNLFKFFQEDMRRLFDMAYQLIKKTNQDTLQSYAAKLGQFFQEAIKASNLPGYCYDMAVYYTALLEAKGSALPEFKIESAPLQKESIPYLYPNVRLYSFEYDVETLIDEKLTQTDLKEIKKEETYYLLFFVEGKLNFLKLSKSTAKLLKFCNGVFNVEKIHHYMNQTYKLSIDHLMEDIFPQIIEKKLVYMK